MSQIELKWGHQRGDTLRFLRPGWTPMLAVDHVRDEIAQLTVNGEPLTAHLKVAAAACKFRASEFSANDDDFDRVNARILLALVGEPDEKS